MFTGEQIREKRKKENLSVEELADKLKLPVQSLYKWEKGTRPNNPEHYNKLESWLRNGLEGLPVALEPEPKYGDLKDEVISLLKKENARLQKDLDFSLGEMRHIAIMNHAILKTLRKSVAQLIAKQERADLLEVAHRLDKETAEFYERTKEKGILI